MTLRTREQAAKFAEGITRFAVGYCQTFTREAFGHMVGVGDVDGDGDADAVDGWLSEPASARHPGDRTPPRGVPVAFSGGSRGYGHRAVSLGGGRIRSTDMGSLGKYAPGLVSTVTIGQIEAAMGVTYTGWTETCSGQVIPGAPTRPPKPPKPAGLSYVTFNLYAGNDAPVRNTEVMLRAAGHPHLATIQEANRLGDVKGYQRLAADPADFPGVEAREVLSTQILVRDDVTVRKHIARAVPGGGWSWNGNQRDPRVFHRAVLEVEGVVSEFWAVHRCPGGPAPGNRSNQAAWNAESMFLFEWVGAKVAKHPGREFVIGGDWNTSKGKAPAHPHSVESLAARLGAEMYLRHIDGFLVISPDVRARPQSREVRKLDRSFGSDAHRPVVLIAT